jgi:hypothetical protein
VEWAWHFESVNELLEEVINIAALYVSAFG